MKCLLYFKKNTNVKNDKFSSIEETILSIANAVRGGYIPATAEPGIASICNFQVRRWTQLLIILLRTALYKEISCKPIQERIIRTKPKTIHYLQRVIDERLIAQDSSNNRELFNEKNPPIFNKAISIPTKFPISQPSVFCHIGNSFNENNLISFNFRNAKICFPIEFSGFQEVDFAESDFYFTFTIKPDYQNTPDAYLIDTHFQGSTFHSSTSFILTKFLFTSSKTPFSNVTYMDSATFKSCIFLSTLLFPHELAIKDCDFQGRGYSLAIEDSLFYVPLSLQDSSIPKMKLSKNYYAFETTIAEVESEQIKIESCNLKSLSIKKIKQIHEDIPEIKIKNSTVQQKTKIDSNIDIHVNESHFKKKSIFGYAGAHPVNKVNISKSVFSELEISAGSEIEIQGLSVEKLDIIVGTNSTIDVSLQGILGVASEFTIDGSRGQIRSLRLNNIYVKKIHFRNIDFSQIEYTRLDNVQCREFQFNGCTLDSPHQEEEIKHSACKVYKNTKSKVEKA